jgi:hypothetical protein
MMCDVSKMRQLAELWMHDAPASPALMLGDQRLAYEALQAADEITRLQAIIDRLPKTADGVPIVPGDTIWFDIDNYSTVAGIEIEEPGGQWWVSFGISGAETDQCYSTREAANKAGGEE